MLRYGLIIACVAWTGPAGAEVLMAANGASFFDVQDVVAAVPTGDVVADRAAVREASADRGLALIALGIALMMIAAPVNDIAKTIAERRLARGD